MDPRLGRPMVCAALASAGHDVRMYCEHQAPVDRHDVLDSDTVGFSTTTSTAPAAYGMADRVCSSGVPVVISGSHVTFMADEALAHADCVARGEGGDQLVIERVAALRGERGLESIAGLRFVRDGRHVDNETRPARGDLEQLPVPDLSLIVGHERMHAAKVADRRRQRNGHDAVHRHGIRVHGMFVLGADGDDLATMRRTVDFAPRHRIDRVVPNVLTPVPGTGWFEEVMARDASSTGAG